MKTVIIGGVAGGATTAARLRRLDESAEIVLIEKGPAISYANCGLPYYIGGVITDRQDLFLQTPESFGRRFACEVRVRHEAVRLDPGRRTVTVKDLDTGRTYEEPFDFCVLSPGAEPFRPPLPGVDDPRVRTLRNVEDTDAIRHLLETRKPSRAAVIGAGFIGLEMAENLRHRGLEVTVVEAAEQVMTPLDYEMAALVQLHLRQKGVHLRLNDRIAGFENLSDRELTVRLASGAGLKAGIVILSIGVRPDTRLAREAGLALGPRGGILVDEFLRTSHPRIYAVGDAVEFPNPLTAEPYLAYLAGPANKQARIAAENIVTGDTVRYTGTFQTAIAKVFDLTVASTGLSEKSLRRTGKPYLASITHSASHAGYYPDAKPLSLKILFSPEDGRLYGAQAVGYEGVDKRIDILSALIRTGGTVRDLVEFEQAYAPPYSSARDPVNVAGLVADNILKQRVRILHWHDLPRLDPASTFLLDVRTPSEFRRSHIPGAVNIPVDHLRERLAEIPKDRRIVVYCGVGLRAYVACRILTQRGFGEVYNLSGGIKTWEYATQASSDAALFGQDTVGKDDNIYQTAATKI